MVVQVRITLLFVQIHFFISFSFIFEIPPFNLKKCWRRCSAASALAVDVNLLLASLVFVIKLSSVQRQ